MAQKIEFVRAKSLKDLKEEYKTFVTAILKDVRFIVTPVGFIKDEDQQDGKVYVMAVCVEATHKTRWDDDEEERGTLAAEG